MSPAESVMNAACSFCANEAARFIHTMPVPPQHSHVYSALLEAWRAGHAAGMAEAAAKIVSDPYPAPHELDELEKGAVSPSPTERRLISDLATAMRKAMPRE